MAVKVFIHFIVVLLLTVLQVSFFAGLFYPWNHINIIIPSILFVSLVRDRMQGVYWILLFIVLGAYYSPYPWWLLLFGLLLVVILVDFFARNFISNKPLYGLTALVFIGTAAYQLIIRTVEYFLFLLKMEDFGIYKHFLFGSLVQMIFSVFITVVLFVLWEKIFSKFEKYFIYN